MPRKDFDPSGHCCIKYVEKGTQCFRSSVPWSQQSKSKILSLAVVSFHFLIIWFPIYLGFLRFGGLNILKEDSTHRYLLGIPKYL